jgi:hypothetical protein
MTPLGTTSEPRGGRRSGGSAAYRLEVASRSLAGVVGGFLLASAFGWLTAALLHGIGAQQLAFAVHSGTLLSWLVWCGAAMWAFYAPRPWGAWAWILVPALAMGGLAAVMTQGG